MEKMLHPQPENVVAGGDVAAKCIDGLLQRVHYFKSPCVTQAVTRCKPVAKTVCIALVDVAIGDKEGFQVGEAVPELVVEHRLAVQGNQSLGANSSSVTGLAGARFLIAQFAKFVPQQQPGEHSSILCEMDARADHLAEFRTGDLLVLKRFSRIQRAEHIDIWRNRVLWRQLHIKRSPGGRLKLGAVAGRQLHIPTIGKRVIDHVLCPQLRTARLRSGS